MVDFSASVPQLERTIWMIKKNVSQHSKIVAKVSTCGKTKRRKVFHQMLINLWGVHPWLGPPSTVHLIIIKSRHSIAAWQSKLRIPKFFEELVHVLSPPPPARFLTCTRKRQGRHRQPRSSWRCWWGRWQSWSWQGPGWCWASPGQARYRSRLSTASSDWLSSVEKNVWFVKSWKKVMFSTFLAPWMRSAAMIISKVQRITKIFPRMNIAKNIISLCWLGSTFYSGNISKQWH